MNKHRLLLVEDNPQDEKLTLRALKNLNMVNKIDVVRDGAEAIDYLFRLNAFSDLKAEPLPDVVLLDIGLPKLNGLDVLRQLRERRETRHLPVVMLTSSDEDKDIVASYQHRANSYVRKPVDAGEFAKAVAQLGGYWLMLNKLPESLDIEQ